MRKRFLFILPIIILVISSCKKDQQTDGCFSDAPTIRKIVDKQAVVKVTGTVNPVYLVEQGSIDTWLIPCDFPLEFLQNDLQVTISGDVKAMPRGDGICCPENIVITKISR